MLPNTVDLTNPVITSGSDADLTFTYWRNAAMTSALPNPKAVSATGTYYIKAVSSTGCVITQAFAVKVTVTSALYPTRYPTVTAGINTSKLLTARPVGNDATYLWQPAVGLSSYTTRTPNFNYNQDVEYTIRATTAGGCVTVDTLLVLVQVDPTQQRSDILVPKAWTPNNDGRNDKLTPIPVRIRKLNFFRIFNRWGEIVYETNELGAGWDGIYKGKPQVTDTYTWMIDAIGQDERRFRLTGNSVLVR